MSAAIETRFQQRLKPGLPYADLVRARASGISGGLRIGADFFARNDLLGKSAGANPPRGVVDHIDDLAHPDIDVTKIDPRVVAFFDDTAGLDLHIRSRWVFPFSIFWRALFFVVRAVGQFVYPRDEGRIVTRVFAVDRDRDGRADARGILRTYVDSDDVMQAVSYATWERAGKRFMSAAFPMMFGRMMGVLRMDPLGDGGVVLTSKRVNDDDAGVWFAIGSVAIPMPLGERLELWPPEAAGAPTEAAPDGIPDATILGRHEQRLFGIRFVTHYYWFWPTGS